MTMFRVWFDDPLDTEDEKGRVYDAEWPVEAAEKFGADQYDRLQHVDPGAVFVRDLATNSVSRWALATIVRVEAEPRPMPEDFDEEPEAYGVARKERAK
jgi:hypothetical protein